jgi:anti-sigma factor RsiW
MTDDHHTFDEALISGYLDGELTQGDRQRVERHLETCDHCAQLATDLRQLQEMTMSSSFTIPNDTQWDERPRSPLSRLASLAGWAIGGLWLVGLVAVLATQAATGNESDRLAAVLVLMPLIAVACIVGSALLDRLDTRRDDPYRNVQK